MVLTHDMDLLPYVVLIPSVWDQPYQPTHHYAQMEWWCQAHLQGTYRLGWYNRWTIELRTATREDHVLAQLTWC